MTAADFAMWLQGFAELNAAPPTPEQWQSIREHLATVFHKVTPPVAAPALSPYPRTDAIKKAAERINRDYELPWPTVQSPRAIC